MAFGRIRTFRLTGILAAALAGQAAPAIAHHVEIERCDLAVFRNDLIAFHATNKAVSGKARFKVKEDSAAFWFASTANLRRFRANLDKYLPRFSKFCRLEAKRRKAAKPH